MPYDIFLETPAQEAYDRQPYLLQEQIELHLDALAESPTLLSRPAPCPPYNAGYQMYQFRCIHEDQVHEFTALFKYGPDEQTLHIYGIGYISRRPR